MKTVNDVRSEFLGFFEKQGHEVVASSSLVPHNDPTLMFTNSGMVQFKDVFTGKDKRPYTRATTAQKCVRAGGKHNDLENVGYTARHHTFFEMLGNFSFGDYFKEEAICFAWELVTKNFALPPEKLCVTVHSSDEEAAAIWKKITGFSDDKIIRIPTDDNFWRMGDTGPCGPCTEIFYDHGEHIWGGPPGSAEEDGDRFIEIWNNVFMQYEQVDADTRIDLPAQSVDTGMGLERIVATLMGSNNNYDIDIMRSLIEHSADLTGVSPDGDMAASHKVIADHMRSCSFLMADGVMPSNEGRGYVLRRIMRRAMRHAHLLGAKDPIMHKLLPTLISKMGEAYPELIRAQSLITQTLETEEKRFKSMLDRGNKMLDEESANLGSGDKFSGAVAFKLYDTYGFPLDLTQDALRAKEIEVDIDEFNKCMAQQKAKARAAWSGAGGEATDKLWFDILDEVGATEFLGYDKDSAEAKVLALVKDGQRVDELKSGDKGIVITNQTPFYAESGGQVGDSGYLSIIGAQPVENKLIDENHVIKTDRLTLSLIKNDDVESVFETLNNETVANALNLFSHPMTMEQAKSWCQKSEAGIKNQTDFMFLAKNEQGENVGHIGIHIEENKIAEIGYWVSKPFQGQGFASEMVKSICKFGFNNFDLETLYASTSIGNEASSNVLLKNNFMYVGVKNITSWGSNSKNKKVYELCRGLQVTDTHKPLPNLIAHYVDCNNGNIKIGDAVVMNVDSKRRAAIKANHSATHLLHKALQQVLGDHVTQKGSLQDDKRTRFDISQPVAMTQEQIAQVEQIVNAQVRANSEVITRIMSIDEARASGAMALFGEKYDDEVRVVSMGDGFSIELCGGTHVKRTGDIGLLKIISESALSSGIRRIEAVTAENALEYLNNQVDILHDAKLLLKTSEADFINSLKDKITQVKKLEKEVKELRKAVALGGSGGGNIASNTSDNIKEIAGVKFTGRILADFPPKDLKPMADDLKAKLGSGVIVLVATNEGKASIVVGVTDDLTSRINAVDLVRVGANVLGGKGGGGRPDMAQAGGSDVSAANDALAAIEKTLAG